MEWHRAVHFVEKPLKYGEEKKLVVREGTIVYSTVVERRRTMRSKIEEQYHPRDSLIPSQGELIVFYGSTSASL